MTFFLPFWKLFLALFIWYILTEILNKLGLLPGKSK